jgi:tryptophan synthase alpha chain
MNRIQKLFKEKNSEILSIYFTAGYPALEDTAKIAKSLEECSVDLVEIGIPFSDPVADGETIQASNEKALKNGMNLKLLFSQIAELRKNCELPVILMGYLNPVMQYGIKEFCEKCKELSVDGTIIPDLPLELYLKEYAGMFTESGLSNICLITPQTSDVRIKYIDSKSDSFIYAVSSAAVTGGAIEMEKRTKYLEHVKSLNLRNPVLVGFGVSTKNDFEEICKYANGAIIGSAFIRALSGSINPSQASKDFVKSIKS